jgi:hypothetical protein
MKVLLLPRDPNDDKNILLEIRGGTGGEEVKRRALHVILAPWQTEPVPVIALHRTGHRGEPRVRALIDHLRAAYEPANGSPRG